MQRPAFPVRGKNSIEIHFPLIHSLINSPPQNAMVDQDVPRPLQQRVISYFDYLWIRNKGVDIKELCSDAPVCLAAELYLEVARPMFEVWYSGPRFNITIVSPVHV